MKSIIPALVGVFFSTSAHAALVDAFNLDVTSAAGTDSNISLALGEIFNIEISGRFFIGSGITGLADAEYFDIPTSPTDTFAFDDIGVDINGSEVNFGAFNPTSIYTTTFVGLGNVINLSYSDCCYGDNSGSLQVKIFDSSPTPVPLPAAFPLLAGGLGLMGLMGWRRKQRKAIAAA